ncbi:glutamate receptor 1-like [Palaemon carinicauda]|uniref:glutamate receptor 1-like n=1 Tax=Palaemon carinicauda TaxID=392227 RepID=UPI0035B5A2B4
MIWQLLTLIDIVQSTAKEQNSSFTSQVLNEKGEFITDGPLKGNQDQNYLNQDNKSSKQEISPLGPSIYPVMVHEDPGKPLAEATLGILDPVGPTRGIQHQNYLEDNKPSKQEIGSLGSRRLHPVMVDDPGKLLAEATLGILDPEGPTRGIQHQNYLEDNKPSKQEIGSLGSKRLPPVMVENPGKLLAEATWGILEPIARDCRFFLITQDSKSQVVFHIGRYTRLSSIPLVLQDISSSQRDNTGVPTTIVFPGVPGICQVILVDMTSGDSIQFLTRFLLSYNLWLLPEAKIILLGRKKHVQNTLWSPAFRNSIHIIYVAYDDATLRRNVTIYSRCLVCNEIPGHARFLASWRLGDGGPRELDLFPYRVTTLQGRLLRATALPFFPYIDYHVNLKDLSQPVALRDSIDKRVIETISPLLNFTYEIYTPPDLSLGTPMENGSWTGLPGLLQRGQADMTLMLSTSDGKLKVMDLARLVECDTLVILSLKPQLTPEYLSIISPFTADVWLYIVLSIMIWGLSLWMLEKLRSKFTGMRGINLNRSIFYSWAVILEDPPPNPPTDSTGQILVGWWLIASLVISTGFRSSLVANLSVPGKTKPIDSYEDLVSQTNWRWGFHDTLLTGQVRIYFENSKDIAMRKIYDNAEAISIEEGLNKILKGGYSLMISYNRVKTTIDSLYADKYGRTIMYVSRNQYKVVTDFGWCFRKGSPYYNLFSGVFNRLIEAGLVNFWAKDTVAQRVRQIRTKMKDAGNKGVMENLDFTSVFDSEEIRLRTRHLIGIYLVTLGGFAVAFLTFLTEYIFNKYGTTK